MRPRERENRRQWNRLSYKWGFHENYVKLTISANRLTPGKKLPSSLAFNSTLQILDKRPALLLG